jgi:hypothetical protein
MCWATSTARSAPPTPACRSRQLADPTADRRAGSVARVRREELERWLCGPGSAVPSLDAMASLFGLCFDAPAGDAATLPHRLRFTVAVLRDAFPSDGAVRRWLRSPTAELGGERPLDLVLRGHVEQLEDLAVAAWNCSSRL